MKKYTTHIILISLVFVSIIAKSQGDSLITTTKGNLNFYNANFVDEKIYIQLDKPFYKPNEIIWFNLTVLEAKNHLPSQISDVVYAELVTPQGSVVKKLTLPIEKGTAKGDFRLPDNTGGLYTIKAYTQWSRNFTHSKLLERKVPVQDANTTRLLMKPDFHKESYGKGDSVVFNIEIRDLKGMPASGASVKYTISLEGQEYIADNTVADNSGEVNIAFKLPNDINSGDGIINAIVTYDGVEESVSRSIPINISKISFRFFPEGGRIVAGQTMKVAFEANDEFGDAVDTEGSIVDEDGNDIVNFKSLHQGMGVFKLKADAQKNYYAKITKPLGVDSLYILPQAMPTKVLTVKSNSNNLVELKIIGEIDNGYILAHNKGVIVYESMLSSQKVFKVNTTDFPIGITVFTLFNSDGYPISERKIFVNSYKNVSIEIEADKETYQPGENVKLEIKTKNYDGTPVQMKMAMAVVDDQLISFADNKEDNILSYFLLSSELEGEIKEPCFYFDSTEVDATEALGILLMVRGWSRFAWREINRYYPDYEPEFLPENDNNISGYLVTKKGKPTKGVLYAYESMGQKRMAKINTSDDGYFYIKGFDQSSNFYLITKKPNKIKIDAKRAKEMKSGYSYYYDLEEMQIETFSAADIPDDLERESFGQDVGLTLMPDLAGLDEVVVVGYGTLKKRDVTGSIASVSPSSFLYYPNMNIAMGEMAGDIMSYPSESPEMPSEISFAKAKSLVAENNAPLVVINGFVLSTSISRHFINSDLFSPDEIDRVDFYYNPATVGYMGGKGANGIIFIESKKRVYYSSWYSYFNKDDKYTGVKVGTRSFSYVREGYSIPKTTKKDKGGERNYLDHLVYWNPEVITDESGKAQIEFVTNDAVSNFRITTEGITGNGAIGRTEKTYSADLPFSIDIKLPAIIGLEDTVIAKMALKNNTEKDISGNLNIESDCIYLKYKNNITVPANSRITVPITITAKCKSSQSVVDISFSSEEFSDNMVEEITVFPIGFPSSVYAAGKNPNGGIEFEITDAEEGSIESEVQIFPNWVKSMESTAKGIVRQPYGCFEQVSAATYPNILAVQYLNTTGNKDDDFKNKAMGYIESGYKRLAAYEVKSGGFEWFGHSPAHEALSAFGLVEFMEMKKITGIVDDKMISRTTDWLLSRRDGKGGFKQNRGKYGFSAASEVVNNAYIVYALSEVGVKDLKLEYNTALAECLESEDLYRMALVALASHNLNDTATYNKLTQHYAELLTKEGVASIDAEHSIVRSYGDNLRVEVIALWNIAFMREWKSNIDFIGTGNDYIIEKKEGERYGSTQSTTLALQSLTLYNLKMAGQQKTGTLEVFVNGVKGDSLLVSQDVSEAIALSEYTKMLKNDSKNRIELRYSDKDASFPFSLSVNWLDKLPKSNDKSPVSLETSVSSNSVKLNEIFRVNVTLTNTKSEGIPMTIARIGIPAGLSLQTWQLVQYQDKRVFDFYEIIGNDLVLYFKEMGPNQVINIPIDLKAEILGSYTGAASSAYLYYSDRDKYWIEGIKVNVVE